MIDYKDFFEIIPNNSILGINYSGMHDTSISIVEENGNPIFATSLEKISKVKQDGRFFLEILDFIPWEKISKVAVSAMEELDINCSQNSSFLENKLPYKRNPKDLKHKEEFNKVLSSIKKEKIYVGHQLSHAASAFFGSGFNDAIALTYDGGMSNELWFGGVFEGKGKKLEPISLFDATKYSKITTLYTFITAILGFSPMKHEGKITGLAATGEVNNEIQHIFNDWFEKRYYNIEKCIWWVNSYSQDYLPILAPMEPMLEKFKRELKSFSHNDIAATIQGFAEEHIIKIIKNIKDKYDYKNICLSGGLFANVKINQKVLECGFDNIFISPAMGDDGTSLGAALYLASKNDKFSQFRYKNMFLGFKNTKDEIKTAIKNYNLVVDEYDNIEKKVAELLSEGKIIATFNGRTEFGPRALGNRSILSQATDVNINTSLNKKLKRTEFMPFAPMTLSEYVNECYLNVDNSIEALKYMTMTVDCTEKMKKQTPAVVHIDNTARPQLISKETYPTIHKIMNYYYDITEIPSIINTSFNIHEEPIVNDIDDAIRGFFLSELDYLYIKNIGLISFSKNYDVFIYILKNKVSVNSELKTNSIINFLQSEVYNRTKRLEIAETDLIDRTKRLEIAETDLIDRTKRLEIAEKKLEEIQKNKSK